MSAGQGPSTVARAWIDGAARGNPGEAGFGVRFEPAAGDGEPEEVFGYLGRATNNVAEYAALLAALTHAVRRGLDRLVLYSDSQLLVRQLAGQYRVKALNLQPFFLRGLVLKRRIPGLEIHHVRRENNREADRLANLAIDQRTPLPDWLELPGGPG